MLGSVDTWISLNFQDFLMTSKTTDLQLIDVLRKLLLKGNTHSQEEIVAILIAQGYDTNQSKISRLLRKLGAIKAKNEKDELIYRLTKEPAPPNTKTALYNLIIDITANENLIVVHTSPGSASLIARLIDHTQLDVIGTIAGDDTILVIPKSVKKIKETEQQVRTLLAGMGN